MGSGLDGVDISADEGQSWHRADGGLTWSLDLDLPEGVYDIWVRWVDIAGGSSITPILNVTIDLTNPWLTITSPKIPQGMEFCYSWRVPIS